MLSESIQGKVSADRISSGLWETFRFEIFERSGFTIKSHHGHYLSVNSEKVLCSTSAGAKPSKNEKFNFELISDPDEKICKQYDVIKEKSMYGKKYMGIERSTFFID